MPLAIYLPTFLQHTYSVSLGTLALALALVALGNLAGNVLGGRIADRVRARGLVFAAASLLTAAPRRAYADVGDRGSPFP